MTEREQVKAALEYLYKMGAAEKKGEGYRLLKPSEMSSNAKLLFNCHCTNTQYVKGCEIHLKRDPKWQ